MPSNLSADERAAVERVEELAAHIERVHYTSIAPPMRTVANPNLLDYVSSLRTLLAVVARAGEAVAWRIDNVAPNASPLARMPFVVWSEEYADRYANDDEKRFTVTPLYAHPVDARDRGDAVRGVLLAFHDWPAHSSAFADGERRRALDTLAATMHAAPAAPEDK